MTIGTRTFIFNIGVIIFNIVIGLIIEGFLYFAILFLLSGTSAEVQNSSIVSVVLPFVLIIGLFAVMSISRKCIIWFIDKFNLRDKLDPNLTKRYPKKMNKL